MNRIIFLVLLSGMVFLAGCSADEAVMTARVDGEETSYEISKEVSEKTLTTEEQTFLYVYVCGEVEEPGVYPLKPGARICDALETAGGITKEGKPEALDQAICVVDGQTIYVPSIYEQMESTELDDGLVDINKADKDLLMTLPGIGESKAELIVEYREEHGAFESVEDLMNIPGIKEGVYNKIKDSIKVS